jgi:hypothetical protein
MFLFLMKPFPSGVTLRIRGFFYLFYFALIYDIPRRAQEGKHIPGPIQIYLKRHSDSKSNVRRLSGHG